MKKALREPLVHFLLLGGLLFLWFQWRGGAAGPGTSRIVVTPGQVRNLASGYTKTWSRPPSEDELKGLIDEYVKEEIATREAMALGLGARTDDLGDATMLPVEMPLGTLTEVRRTFGDDFARRLAEVPGGEWSGPLTSSYGLHLVLVSDRVEAEAPSLAAIRPLVARELLAERQKRELQALYEKLLAKYDVTIEMPKAEPGPEAAGAAAR